MADKFATLAPQPRKISVGQRRMHRHWMFPEFRPRTGLGIQMQRTLHTEHRMPRLYATQVGIDSRKHLCKLHHCPCLRLLAEHSAGPSHAVVAVRAARKIGTAC
jgi:hypothetical protein